MPIQSINALTLATHDMARAVHFYLTLGFRLRYGGADATFTSFRFNEQHLNLILVGPERHWAWWGRVIFHVENVDEMHARALAGGYTPEAPPRDAPWGERYFHLTDMDGHELSFARLLDDAD
jgi:catechol 2,3-dioxygenase-like lactoylglutathione lyase family enzyme